MLDHRLRRWPSIEATLGRCVVFTVPYHFQYAIINFDLILTATHLRVWSQINNVRKKLGIYRKHRSRNSCPPENWHSGFLATLGAACLVKQGHAARPLAITTPHHKSADPTDMQSRNRQISGAIPAHNASQSTPRQNRPGRRHFAV